MFILITDLGQGNQAWFCLPVCLAVLLYICLPCQVSALSN